MRVFWGSLCGLRAGGSFALPPFQQEADIFLQLTTGEADSLAKTSLHCRAAATVRGKT